MTITKELVHPYSFVGMKGTIFIPPSSLRKEEKIQRAKDIINACMKYYNIPSIEKMMKKDRSEPLVTARHIAAYLIKQNTQMIDSEICKFFNRDRTTIIHSIELINGYIKIGEPKHILEEIKEIKMML